MTDRVEYTVYISNALRGPVLQLTCPMCGGELPTLFPPVAVRENFEREEVFVGMFVVKGDPNFRYSPAIPAPLLCCTTACERRLMTERRLRPIWVDAVVDDGTRKRKKT